MLELLVLPILQSALIVESSSRKVGLTQSNFLLPDSLLRVGARPTERAIAAASPAPHVVFPLFPTRKEKQARRETRRGLLTICKIRIAKRDFRKKKQLYEQLAS